MNEKRRKTRPNYEFFEQGITEPGRLSELLEVISDPVLVALVIVTGLSVWKEFLWLAGLSTLLIPGWGWLRYIVWPEDRHRRVPESDD